LDPLAQEYFKQDVGTASRIDVSHFQEDLIQHPPSFHCDVANLTNRLARLERRRTGSARREKTGRIEVVIVTAVSYCFKHIYGRLRMRLSNFGKDNSYQRII
jgi:hypothetical protein